MSSSNANHKRQETGINWNNSDFGTKRHEKPNLTSFRLIKALFPPYVTLKLLIPEFKTNAAIYFFFDNYQKKSSKNLFFSKNKSKKVNCLIKVFRSASTEMKTWKIGSHDKLHKSELPLYFVNCLKYFTVECHLTLECIYLLQSWESLSMLIWPWQHLKNIHNVE